MGWMFRNRSSFQLKGRKLVPHPNGVGHADTLEGWLMSVGTRINSVGHGGPASDHVTAALHISDWLGKGDDKPVVEVGGIGTASTLRMLTQVVFEKFDEGLLPQLREVARRKVAA